MQLQNNFLILYNISMKLPLVRFLCDGQHILSWQLLQHNHNNVYERDKNVPNTLDGFG